MRVGFNPDGFLLQVKLQRYGSEESCYVGIYIVQSQRKYALPKECGFVAFFYPALQKNE
jgi:hypothetical protein